MWRNLAGLDDIGTAQLGAAFTATDRLLLGFLGLVGIAAALCHPHPARILASLVAVAIVHADACNGCGDCLAACPYTAIEIAGDGNGAGPRIATISETACKGCGGCVPLCPENAIDLRGYTDAQITSMIDNLLEVSVP